MTRDELYTFTTSLTAGVAIDSDLFDTLLDVAQMQVEDMRPWVKLRAEDTSLTVSPGNTYTTSKALPADWKEWYDESSIELVDANNNPMPLLEIPYKDRLMYRNSSGKYTVDYANNVVYILGPITQSYTLKQNYIEVPTLVSSAASATWVFPERFHKILALMVAIFWKHGVDYDIINNLQADNQAVQVRAILDLMTRWDSNLQANMQRGKEFFSEGFNGIPNGTHIS